jgi:uncharacterized RDD family membrane protein YckC
MTEISPSEPDRIRCGLFRRLAAISYDSIVVLGLLLIAAAVASPFDQGNQQAFRDPFFTLYLFAVGFFYLAVCWMNGGMTLGMRAWKLLLIADNDHRIGWKLCAVRFTAALISTALLGAGFAWSLFDPQKRCWHDIASRSGLYRN